MKQSSVPLNDLLALPMLQALQHPAFLLSGDLLGFQANPAFLDLFPEFPLSWEMVLNWVHEKDRERVRLTALFRLKGDQPFTLSFEATSHEGTPQLFQAHLAPLMHHRDVQGWLGTVERLDHSKMYLQAIVDHLPLTMMVLDLEGEVKIMNQALSEVVAKGKDHYLGKNILQADAHYGPVFMGVIKEIQQHPEALPPREYQTPQGQHWRTFHFPVKSPEGELLGVGSASLNITEHKQSQRQVEDHQRFLQRLTDEIPATVQLRNMTTGEVVFQNRYATEVLGYTWEEVKHFSREEALSHFHEDDLPRLYAVAEGLKTLPDGESIEGEYRVRHKDGSWKWIFARLSIFERSAEGVPLQSLSVGLDVTERDCNCWKATPACSALWRATSVSCPKWPMKSNPR